MVVRVRLPVAEVASREDVPVRLRLRVVIVVYIVQILQAIKM